MAGRFPDWYRVLKARRRNQKRIWLAAILLTSILTAFIAGGIVPALITLSFIFYQLRRVEFL